ncbi:MAG: family 43 glycosylhydrolase [Bacteroidales bacterium]|nr:family 43 glycosylhydrolase [Bacteroidales bacterium]
MKTCYPFLLLGLVAASCSQGAVRSDIEEDSRIRVNAEPKVKVESLVLDRTSAEIKEGESITLSAGILPEDAVSTPVEWTSPDISVATVDDGVVTGVRAGVTTIVAIAGAKSAACEITVTYGDVPSGKRVPLADPFVLYDNGKYYLYGTGADDGIAVYESLDLRTWRVPGGGTQYLALDKSDSYGDKWFWAPEVYKVDGKFYMYYSADERICAAVSDSPLGPFTQKDKRPMLNYGSIDNSLFVDDSGKPWLFYVRFNNGNEVWSAELESDLITVRPGTEKFCLRADTAWEMVYGSVTEGPFVLKHDGTYYLTYSANSYESPDYAVGYAVASSPSGPWTKYSGNPILHKAGGLEGVGHHAFFNDADGKGRIVFHSHNSPGTVQPRVLHIGSYDFGADGVLVIDRDFFTPALD